MDERLFIKGFSYGFMARRGEYKSEEAFNSLKKLSDTGCEWIALCMVVNQERYNSTEIRFDYNETPTDMEIVEIIEKAHKLGMKVCLKPIINCKDGLWRARITFPEEGDYWDKWFYEYKGFLKHYAEVAKFTNCEMLCLGCEMVGTEHKEAEWREVITIVKEEYKGKLVYNANHGKEKDIAWFDELDFIGTSAYYPVAEKGGECEEVMIERWTLVRERMEELHKKFNKPIIFMEIGCRSAQGCASMPWDFMMKDFPYDEDEQANFYSSCIKVFNDLPWFSGYFWWDWSHKLQSVEEAKSNTGFGIYGKKAEEVIRKWYSK